MGRRRAPRIFGLPAVAVDLGYSLLVSVVPLFRRFNITPNALSCVSLPVSVLAAITIAHGSFAAGGALMLLAFSFDAWDGLLARDTATASDAGEVVDATIDRYNDVIVMLGFLYYYRLDALPWLLASAALVGTVLVSYTRAKGEAFGVVAELGIMQRPDRAAWLGVATLIAPGVAMLGGDRAGHARYYSVLGALAIVAIGTNITAIRRARFVITRLNADTRVPAETLNPGIHADVEGTSTIPIDLSPHGGTTATPRRPAPPRAPRGRRDEANARPDAHRPRWLRFDP
jgi:CDP-diacylglycerol--glycerol-3-phosphate 3-phosphatidyltransferase